MKNPGPITAANNGLVVLCGVAAGMHIQSRLQLRMKQIEAGSHNVATECIVNARDAEVVELFGMPDVVMYDQRSNQVTSVLESMHTSTTGRSMHTACRPTLSSLMRI